MATGMGLNMQARRSIQLMVPSTGADGKRCVRRRPVAVHVAARNRAHPARTAGAGGADPHARAAAARGRAPPFAARSEEHTSELQSQSNLVCRLLLEKKKKSNERR